MLKLYRTLKSYLSDLLVNEQLYTNHFKTDQFE
jgi:hypothetical protein